MSLFDRVGVASATSGTVTLALGTAIAADATIFSPAFRSFVDAAVPDNTVVTYLILDSNGNVEWGRGTVTSTGTSLSRDLVSGSIIAGVAGTTKINCSGSVQVFISPVTDDFYGYTGTGDTAYTVKVTDIVVATNAAFTAARAWTLPAASLYPKGRGLVLSDAQGTVTATNTLTISRAGSDLINGGTSILLSQKYAIAVLVSDGVSKWTIVSMRKATKTTYFTSAGASTFTTSTNPAPREIFVRGRGAAGGGGGGAGSTAGGNGGAGSATSFGAGITFNGGGGGFGGGQGNLANGGTSGAGGSSGSGADFYVRGASGAMGGAGPGAAGQVGGNGGGEGGGQGQNGAAGLLGVKGGGGAGGASGATAGAGAGGGQGEYGEVTISAPATSYTVTNGTGGTAGAAGTSGAAGAVGGDGWTAVEERF